MITAKSAPNIQLVVGGGSDKNSLAYNNNKPVGPIPIKLPPPPDGHSVSQCCLWQMRPLKLCVLLGLFVSFVVFLATRNNSASTDDESVSQGRSNGGGRSGLAYNDTFADDILREMCDAYKEGLLSGDLCSSLCYYYDDWDIIDYHSSTKHVIILNHAGQKYVLKTQLARHRDYDQLPPPTNQNQHNNNTEFINLIRQKINELLGIGWTEAHAQHLIPVVWPSFARSESLSAADRLSLWTLVQQHEYVTFAVLPLARVFPKVMGSCGHVYAVEYVVPFRMKPQYSNLRAKILVHLMGTLKLFYEFLNEPLHWCDAKFDNFGLSAEYPKRFLLMDADAVFTESKMNHIFEHLSCKTDADCQFMDCEAKCNNKTRVCGQRVNDNVEVFCKKFVTTMFTSPTAYKNNRYISACHNKDITNEQRLKELRVVWAWSLSDI